MDKSKIREIFLKSGFTIKEGQSDLKDYVYNAAYSLLEEADKEENNMVIFGMDYKELPCFGSTKGQKAFFERIGMMLYEALEFQKELDRSMTEKVSLKVEMFKTEAK